jgi:protein-disulfide isomerase
MTKRELREERRAARQAKEREEQIKATRRKRLTRLAGALGVAVVAVVIAIVATSSGSSKAVEKPATATTTAAVQEHNGVLGDPKAPVTITEYLDLQCPICKEAAASELPTLIDNYVKTGKVKLQARTLHFIGDDSTKAAKIAAGAEQQGKLWPFIETFYANQGQENSGYVTDGFLKSVAQAAGVDYAKASAYAKTDGAQAALDTADADAQKVGADSTPTFTIKQGNGAEKVLVVGPTGLTQALDAALKA